MKLSIEGLKEELFWSNADIAIPQYNVEAVAEKTKKSPIWLHFGAGNIFRIFIGCAMDSLLNTGEAEKGITCAETFDFDVIDKIYNPYDNLVLAVTLKSDGTTKKQVLGSLTEAIKADASSSTHWERLQEIFCSTELQMVSFTITEKGYSLRGADGSYLSFIQTDIEKGPQAPTSAMAVTASLLYKRYQAGAAPIALVSMDNCSHNGDKLRAAVTEIADEWHNRGFVTTEYLNYIKDETKVAFPWSMIDKITPRPSKEIADELERAGILSMQPIVTSKNTYIAPFVNAEGPGYLVIEDNFPNGRPKLEQAGIYFTDRETVNKVERMKVTTCLNPLHTALAVYGCLLGYTLISDEMKDPELSALVHQIGPIEGMPVVTAPGILSPEAFVREVISERLPNPFMPDAPQRIACDTSQKMGIRYGETIKSYRKLYGDAGNLTFIPLAIAGWCRYLLAIDDNGNAFELSPDPLLRELTEQLKDITLGNPDTYHGQLNKILSNANIFGINLYEAGLGDKIEEMFLKLLAGTGAVRNTLKAYLD